MYTGTTLELYGAALSHKHAHHTIQGEFLQFLLCRVQYYHPKLINSELHAVLWCDRYVC